MEDKKWNCLKCGVPLVLQKTQFSYLGRTFNHEVPRCPTCGNVFIPRALADGRMAEVEQQMEDK
jgi:predicted RNA-binding Zn-ribbon protein involved in translation (DUF1610 family)